MEVDWDACNKLQPSGSLQTPVGLLTILNLSVDLKLSNVITYSALKWKRPLLTGNTKLESHIVLFLQKIIVCAFVFILLTISFKCDEWVEICWIIIMACRWIKRWLVLRNKRFHSSPPAVPLLRLWLMTHSQIEPVRRKKRRFQAEIREERELMKSQIDHSHKRITPSCSLFLFSVHALMHIWTD